MVAAAPLPGQAQQQFGLHTASNGAVDVDSLLDELARPDQQRWRRIERQIMREWSRSGSAAVDYLFQRGQQAMRAGQPRAAIDHFSAAIDHDPDFAEAWHARASAWFMDNRYGLSMADLEQALARNPRHFGALAGLGAILEQVGDLERAREAYAASHSLNPHRQSVREALERLDLALTGRAL
ncbi:MAG: tetratricopeptide repeat protein [Pararhodobacter sp.]|nr:tetratricopeptide repeat protein [Pararhodobacter sp.]